MKQQQILQKEALEIVERLGLLGYLKQLGTARIMGSVLLETVKKPDIQIHLLINQTHSVQEAIKKTCNYLETKHDIKKIETNCYSEKNATKIGFFYPGKTTKWDIEIWVTDELEKTAFKNTEKILKKMTPQHREIIMAMKKHFYAKGLLRHGMSTKIYYAVLEKNKICFHHT